MLKDSYTVPSPTRAASWFSLPYITSCADVGKSLAPQTPDFLCLYRRADLSRIGGHSGVIRLALSLGFSVVSVLRTCALHARNAFVTASGGGTDANIHPVAKLDRTRNSQGQGRSQAQ